MYFFEHVGLRGGSLPSLFAGYVTLLEMKIQCKPLCHFLIQSTYARDVETGLAHEEQVELCQTTEAQDIPLETAGGPTVQEDKMGGRETRFMNALQGHSPTLLEIGGALIFTRVLRFRHSFTPMWSLLTIVSVGAALCLGTGWAVSNLVLGSLVAWPCLRKWQVIERLWSKVYHDLSDCHWVVYGSKLIQSQDQALQQLYELSTLFLEEEGSISEDPSEVTFKSQLVALTQELESLCFVQTESASERNIGNLKSRLDRARRHLIEEWDKRLRSNDSVFHHELETVRRWQDLACKVDCSFKLLLEQDVPSFNPSKSSSLYTALHNRQPLDSVQTVVDMERSVRLVLARLRHLKKGLKSNEWSGRAIEPMLIEVQKELKYVSQCSARLQNVCVWNSQSSLIEGNAPISRSTDLHIVQTQGETSDNSDKVTPSSDELIVSVYETKDSDIEKGPVRLKMTREERIERMKQERISREEFQRKQQMKWLLMDELKHALIARNDTCKI